MNYGERLKELRERQALSIVSIANILNISDSLYSRYEKELQTIPIKHLITLCKYFNVSLNYIFGFTKNKENFFDIDINLSKTHIKEFRKEYNLTQEKLAKTLNTTKTVICGYEKGRYLIATSFLYAICKKYNVSADYLLGRIDNPKYLR